MRTIEAKYLTTKDNPFNPLKQFDEWYNYDMQKGYNTCSLLARFAKTSSDLSNEENIKETNYAIDRILKLDLGPHFVVISKEVNLD